MRTGGDRRRRHDPARRRLASRLGLFIRGGAAGFIGFAVGRDVTVDQPDDSLDSIGEAEVSRVESVRETVSDIAEPDEEHSGSDRVAGGANGNGTEMDQEA